MNATDDKPSSCLRIVNIDDAQALCDIYNYYITNTLITFEEEPLSIEAMETRIRTISSRFPWLVWEAAGEILGYAYLNVWKARTAYRFSVEDSIYLKPGYEGRGMGRELLRMLLEQVKRLDIHTVIAGITLPNARSVGLHEGFGFTKIAQFNEIGFKFNRWLDVGYYELILP
ncbi:MAG: GNAT family N-acetyltransferase [Treponema sp.]|nr:GNAT family N-acetyltransferase [Treponema sp.]